MSGNQVLPSGGGRQLAESILAACGQAGLRPGSRLPTERQLAANLGVTRSGIRHALAALEADGLISREVGRGTFFTVAAASTLGSFPVAHPAGPSIPASALDALYPSPSDPEGRAFPPPSDPGGPVFPVPGRVSALDALYPPPGQPPLSPVRPAATDFAPADVMTIRRLLEPQAMPLVVIWATARDFGEMDRCIVGGDHAASFEEFETWDLALHRSIMAAAHSPLLAALYGLIESARHAQVWGDMKRRSSTRERRELYQQDHRAIVTALRARDTEASVEAMRVHLARVAEHLLGEAR